MRDEPKSVLENVARLERENADLKARIAERLEREAAEEKLSETVQTRMPANAKPSTVRVAAAISFGLAFGLVMLAMTLLLMPPMGGGYHPSDMRGGSAGVCR
jgi:anti-sigma factor RsiW